MKKEDEDDPEPKEVFLQEGEEEHQEPTKAGVSSSEAASNAPKEQAPVPSIHVDLGGDDPNDNNNNNGNLVPSKDANGLLPENGESPPTAATTASSRNISMTSLEMRRQKLSDHMHALLSFRFSAIESLVEHSETLVLEEEQSNTDQKKSTGDSDYGKKETDVTEGTQTNPNHPNPTNFLTLLCSPREWAHATCLNPQNTLRAQLLWAFGGLNFITTAILVALCIGVTLLVGQDFQTINEETVLSSATSLQAVQARYMAEALQHRILPYDQVNILYEMTRDRFAGYPIAEGDEFVPFRVQDFDGDENNTATGSNNAFRRPQQPSITNHNRRQYPIIGPKLALEWQLTQDEQINSPQDQQRRARYSSETPLSFTNAAFLLPAGCDPAQRDPNQWGHFSVCTRGNNDVAAGPFFQPANTTAQIYQKASDLTPLLKSLYEYNGDAHEISIYFANQGAGAGLYYPHYPIDGRNKFVSDGCDWMSSTINPVNPSKGPILPESLTQRCIPKGQSISSRLFNPMLRGWCRRQAQQPDRIVVEGPYLDSFSPDNWLLSMGRAVYDPHTDEFVACTYVGIQIAFLQTVLQESRLTTRSEISIVRWDALGTVVASSAYNITAAAQNKTSGDEGQLPLVADLKVGMLQQDYEDLHNLVDYTGEWNPENVKEAYSQYARLRSHGFYVSAYPIPSVPDEYDPDYRPEFFVIVSLAESDINDVVLVVNDSVDDRVERSIWFALLVGTAGFLFSIGVLLLVARGLTEPLEQMNLAAEEICNSFGTPADVAGDQSIHSVTVKSARCMPKTEVAELVARFNEMVSSFSGSLLTRSEKSKQIEIANSFLVHDSNAKGVRTDLSDDLYRQQNSAQFPLSEDDGDIVATTSEQTPVPPAIPEHSSDTGLGEGDMALNVTRSDSSEDHEEMSGNDVEASKVSDIVSDITAAGATHDISTAVDSTHDFSEHNEVDDSEDGEENPENVATFANIIHTGRNLVFEEISDPQGKVANLEEEARSISKESVVSKAGRIARGLRSPLFLWIVILIVVPMMITTIVISTVVLLSIAEEFDDSIDDSGQHYFEIELQAMKVTARQRAALVASNTARPSTELYLLTRYGSWLLFGGLERADGAPASLSAVDKCKAEGSYSQCPWAVENRVCDCDWNSAEYQDICLEYPNGSRDLQLPYFFASSDQAAPDGTRNGTDFPLSHYSPETTHWWNGIENLPGFFKGQNTSVADTSYGRIMTVLASPLFATLHNYKEIKQGGAGFYYSFEDDGSFVGYDGCLASEHGWAAYWQSSVENGGPRHAPDLCPEGRFGYDARCREWYATGKKEALETGNSLYITSPYLSSSGTDLIFMSATAPLVDPSTKRHVGQVLVDFFADDTFRAMSPANTLVKPGGFLLVITTVSDEFGGDVVIGPNFDVSSPAVPVRTLVLPYDMPSNCRATEEICQTRMDDFAIIVESMKNGDTGVKEFVRSTPSGGSEVMVIAYSASNIRYLDPADSSDFANGTVANDRDMFSVAIVQTKESILEPFAETEDDMNEKMATAIVVVSAFVAFALVVALLVSYQVARRISLPILYLLKIVKNISIINGQNIPAIDRNSGTKEIIYVADTIHGLYKAVSLANAFFRAGELEAAYNLLVDALNLFKRMDNKKAIGVAYNNLGNTLLIIYREMVSKNVQTNYGLTMKGVMKQGIASFNEAIKLGEAAYDEFYDKEGWTPNCLDFMQHLSNRYFNRAMFLLIIKGNHDQPNEIEHIGMRDLEIARDMDLEVIAYGEEIGWNTSHRVEDVFNVGLIRIRGHILLLEMGYPDTWDLEGKFEALFDLLKEESKKPASMLFDEMNYTARRQELETEMIRFTMCKRNVQVSARVAIRPLVEDEYILLSTHIQAIFALIAFVEFQPGLSTSKRADLTKYLVEMCYRVKDTYDRLADKEYGSGSVVLEEIRSSVSTVFSKSISMAAASARAKKALPSHDSVFPDYVSWQIVTMEQF